MVLVNKFAKGSEIQFFQSKLALSFITVTVPNHKIMICLFPQNMKNKTSESYQQIVICPFLYCALESVTHSLSNHLKNINYKIEQIISSNYCPLLFGLKSKRPNYLNFL